MSNFKSALARTLKFEGGYSNDPDDAGGETYRGISRKNFPGWEGWLTVDNLRYAKLCPDGNLPLETQVEDFYRAHFWNPIHGDDLPEALARELFDFAVNCGIGTAVRAVQRIAGVTADGGFGPATLAAVLKADVGATLAAIKQARRARYYMIAAGNPAQAKFLKGWLRRVDDADVA